MHKSQPAVRIILSPVPRSLPLSVTAARSLGLSELSLRCRRVCLYLTSNKGLHPETDWQRQVSEGTNRKNRDSDELRYSRWRSAQHLKCHTPAYSGSTRPSALKGRPAAVGKGRLTGRLMYMIMLMFGFDRQANVCSSPAASWHFLLIYISPVFYLTSWLLPLWFYIYIRHICSHLCCKQLKLVDGIPLMMICLDPFCD